MIVEKKRIGDVLVSLGFVSEEDLANCLGMQKECDSKIGEILVREKLITKEQLYAVLEFQLGVPYADLSIIDIDMKASDMISENLARKNALIPFGIDAGVLHVAMSDPFDMLARDDIRLITGMTIEVFISAKEDIMKAINNSYRISEVVERALVEIEEQGFLEIDDQALKDQAALDEEIDKAPVVRLVTSILTQAVKMRASDIHIESFESSIKVRYRIDGDLLEIMSPPKSSQPALIARLKIMGGMDIAERRIPQDGRIEMLIEKNEFDMRVSILPTVFGEKVVIRILDRSSIAVTKENLGFTQHNIEMFDKIIKAPEGIILITGPTGSGKTTTLYAVLRELNQPHVNIITIEDPVEYRVEGINQVQVNAKAGLTFAAGLRSILRQDPDIVMVGEIRDTETAEIAVRAAITGHVVLSTLHTNDTASTISRLVDMGIERFLVSSAVVGIVAQRLVKRICTNCKTERVPTISEMMILGMDEPTFLYEGKGCNSCGKTGYSGRIAIHEILIMDKDIRAMIVRNEPIDAIKDEAIRKGMRTLHQSCQELVLEGVTTIHEMHRVTYSVDN